MTLLEAMLPKHGFQTLSARGGREAVSIATRSHPDLILPDQDGFETCTQLKAHPLTSEIPVIFLSATTDTNTKC